MSGDGVSGGDGLSTMLDFTLDQPSEQSLIISYDLDPATIV